MEYTITDDQVIVKLDIDTLVCAFENKDDNYGLYKIKDRNIFAAKVAQYLEDYSKNQETGLTVLQEALDAIFDEMIIDANDDCIEYEEVTE